jgi:hypothetical protein
MRAPPPWRAVPRSATSMRTSSATLSLDLAIRGHMTAPSSAIRVNRMPQERVREDWEDDDADVAARTGPPPTAAATAEQKSWGPDSFEISRLPGAVFHASAKTRLACLGESPNSRGRHARSRSRVEYRLRPLCPRLINRINALVPTKQNKSLRLKLNLPSRSILPHRTRPPLL